MNNNLTKAITVFPTLPVVGEENKGYFSLITNKVFGVTYDRNSLGALTIHKGTGHAFPVWPLKTRTSIDLEAVTENKWLFENGFITDTDTVIPYKLTRIHFEDYNEQLKQITGWYLELDDCELTVFGKEETSVMSCSKKVLKNAKGLNPDAFQVDLITKVNYHDNRAEFYVSLVFHSYKKQNCAITLFEKLRLFPRVVETKTIEAFAVDVTFLRESNNPANNKLFSPTTINES